MKKIVTIFVLICMLSVELSGCGNSNVTLGTYQNENNAEQQVIITESSIKIVNVSFEEFKALSANCTSEVNEKATVYPVSEEKDRLAV